MAPPSSQRPPRKFALGLAAGALCLLLAAVGLGIVYTGTHNLAATEEHPSIGRWALDTAFHRSVKALANAKPCASTAMAALSTAKQSQAIS